MQKVKNYIVNELAFYKVPFIIETVAVPLSIIAALEIAWDTQTANFVFAYTCFLIAAIMMAYSGFLRNAIWLVVLNCTFASINTLGLVRALL